MKKPKFTKGPWLVAADTFVYGQGPNGTNSFFLDVTFPGPERICDEEAMANAYLIASAPELYWKVDELKGQLRDAEANRINLVAALSVCVEQLEDDDPESRCMDNNAADYGRSTIIKLQQGN